jgi:hypothetical protein
LYKIVWFGHKDYEGVQGLVRYDVGREGVACVCASFHDWFRGSVMESLRRQSSGTYRTASASCIVNCSASSDAETFVRPS